MISPRPDWPRRQFLRIVALTAVLPRGITLSMAAESLPFPISDHCDGRRFFNPRGMFERSLLRLLRWKLGRTATRWPSRVDVTPRQPPPAPGDDTIAATWINHATFLLRTRHGTLVTDPIWSDRTGPGRLGPRRAHEPGVRFADLPRIDFVLLSHDHYDHCDMTTLARLAARDAPTVIAPLGYRALLKDAKIAPGKVIELDWWQTHAPADSALSITLTPARHWSNRLSGPVNGRLWGGFFIRHGSNATWFAGDTAYDDRFFREIREKIGAPRLALIPIGAYEPRWFMAPAHCNPAEAVQIHRDVGAQTSIGMHWGTFQLTDEGREAPVEALARARADAGLPPDAFRTLAPGESFNA